MRNTSTCKRIMFLQLDHILIFQLFAATPGLRMAQCALLVSGQRPYNNLSHFTADLFWGTRGFAWLMFWIAIACAP